MNVGTPKKETVYSKESIYFDNATILGDQIMVIMKPFFVKKLS